MPHSTPYHTPLCIFCDGVLVDVHTKPDEDHFYWHCQDCDHFFSKDTYHVLVPDVVDAYEVTYG